MLLLRLLRLLRMGGGDEADAPAPAGGAPAEAAAPAAPQPWALKGQGRANAVFAAPGDAGHVLRVRRRRAPPDAAHARLEALTWGPALPGWHALPPLRRELAYARDVLAPALGREYVAVGVRAAACWLRRRRRRRPRCHAAHCEPSIR